MGKRASKLKTKGGREGGKRRAAHHSRAPPAPRSALDRVVLVQVQSCLHPPLAAQRTSPLWVLRSDTYLTSATQLALLVLPSGLVQLILHRSPSSARDTDTDIDIDDTRPGTKRKWGSRPARSGSRSSC